MSGWVTGAKTMHATTLQLFTTVSEGEHCFCTAKTNPEFTPKQFLSWQTEDVTQTAFVWNPQEFTQ